MKINANKIDNKNKELTAKKISNIDVSGIRKIFELAKTIKNPIKVNIGLPDFELKRSVIDKASEAMLDGKNEYTSTVGIDELREKIAQRLNKKQNLNYKKENIIITSAGTGALSIAVTSLANPGDEFIYMDPAFVIYEPLILQNNAVPVSVSVSRNFHLDLKKIEEAVTPKTKAIIINSPNNPTGRIYREDELRKLSIIAKENNLVIISDEVYKDFVYEGLEHISIAKFFKNTLIADSFSKTYAMTGWRVGYLAGPVEIINEAIKVEQFNYVCPPTPLQHACVDALDWDISEHIDDYEKRAEYVYDNLKHKYKLTKPEGAFYLYIKYPYNGEKFIKDCLDKKLLVVPGKAFSKEDTHFRISFAAKMSHLKEAVVILNSLI